MRWEMGNRRQGRGGLEVFQVAHAAAVAVVTMVAYSLELGLRLPPSALR